MNLLFLENLSRSLITFSLLLQLFTMVTKKNIKINGYAFVTYSFSSFLMAYVYKTKDVYFTNRVLFKIFNSTVLFIIGILALK